MEDATGFLWKTEVIRQELNAASTQDVEDTIWDWTADPSIAQATSWTLESWSFFWNLSKCNVEDDTVVKLFAAHGKRHVHKCGTTG